MAMTVEEALKLGMEKHSAGQLPQAEAIYRQVLRQSPNHPQALHLMGIVAQQVGRFEIALDLTQRAIAQDPTAASFHANLGLILMILGRMDEAAAAAQKAVALKPDDYRAWQNLAVVLGRQGRREEALAASRQTMALQPDNPEAHWNLALALLQLGEFAQGWEEFDSRLKIKRLNLDRGFSKPMWSGEDLTGKTILLHAEGGFGDALHFVRYVEMMRDRNARLILECQPSLVRLFSQIKGPERVIARSESLGDFDFHIPLQSLPRIFKTRLDNIPNSVPYLSAPPDRLAHWAGRVPHDDRINVGLNWAGSGLAPSLLDVRSRPLSDFAPLAQVPHVRFHSLQVGPSARQARPAGMEVIDYSADLYDFAETAALTQQMDLIITVDTAMPHLAGALGKPVWVLMPFDSDFRWLLNRTDSPWYPTMRLFRQPRIGDWEEPTSAVVRELWAFRK